VESAKAPGSDVEVSGRVLDEAGKPLAGVKLLLWQGKASPATPARRARTPLPPRAGQGRTEGETDRRGKGRGLDWIDLDARLAVKSSSGSARTWRSRAGSAVWKADPWSGRSGRQSRAPGTQGLYR